MEPDEIVKVVRKKDESDRLKKAVAEILRHEKKYAKAAGVKIRPCQQLSLF